MYLMVQNRGEADVKDMTLLGLSTSRGQSDRIGQFGTGFIHGVTALLRKGIFPEVYVGRKKVSFEIDDHKQEVIARYGGKRMPLNVCVQFGELDWKDPVMGLREFISNAIDADQWQPDTVQKVARPSGKEGYTRVFVPMYEPVQQYHQELPSQFLHATGSDQSSIIVKPAPSSCRVYRKGVFVRELNHVSLFDYNLDEDTQIDECRNMSDWSARDGIMSIMRKTTDKRYIMAILSAVVADADVLEVRREFTTYSWQTWSDAWVEVWRSMYGEKVIVIPEMAQYLARKTKDYVAVHQPHWFASLIGMGLPSYTEVMSRVETQGMEELPPTKAAIDTVDQVWSLLSSLGMTNGKKKPVVKLFRSLMNGGSDVHGQYSSGTVFLREDHDHNKYVALHECAHHITGADDETYDFSEFAFRLAHAVAFGGEPVTV